MIPGKQVLFLVNCKVIICRKKKVKVISRMGLILTFY